MARRNKVFWTRQAREDLRQIRDFIALDAPITAATFVARLRSSVDRLRTFPESGQIVPEIGRSNIREILFGQYRILYRVAPEKVEILSVFHGARLLDELQ